MNDDELVAVIRALRVRVDLARDTVRGPARVWYAHMRFVDRIKLQTALHFSNKDQINQQLSVQMKLSAASFS